MVLKDSKIKWNMLLNVTTCRSCLDMTSAVSKDALWLPAFLPDRNISIQVIFPFLPLFFKFKNDDRSAFPIKKFLLFVYALQVIILLDISREGTVAPAWTFEVSPKTLLLYRLHFAPCTGKLSLITITASEVLFSHRGLCCLNSFRI